MAAVSDRADSNRRKLLGATTLGLAAASFGLGAAPKSNNEVRSNAPNPTPQGPPRSFPALRHIEAGVLNVAYAEEGPPDGHPVLLLHGWPYDIHSYVDVAPILAAHQFRVIVPNLRGYGETRFRSSQTPRNGQQAVFAVDAIALMDALKIEKAILGGFDWGARTVNIMAALCKMQLTDSPSIEASAFMASIHGAMLSARALGDPSLFREIANQSVNRLRQS